MNKWIDWSVHDQYSEDTCQCKCGAVFRSHSKFVIAKPGIVSRRPCPSCGSCEDLVQTTSDYESQSI